MKIQNLWLRFWMWHLLGVLSVCHMNVLYTCECFLYSILFSSKTESS